MADEEYESEDYAIALQKAIEHHCRGKEIPRSIEKLCPYHTNLLNNSTIKNKKEDTMKDRIQIDGICYVREDKLLVTSEKLKEVESNFQAIKNHLGRLNDRLIIAETSSEECLKSLVTSKEEEISGLKADVVYHRGRESALFYENTKLKGQVAIYHNEANRLANILCPEYYTSSLETEIVAVEPVYTKDSKYLRLTVYMPQTKFKPTDKIKIYKLGK